MLCTEKRDAFYNAQGNVFQYEGFMDRAYRFILDAQLMREDLWARFVRQFREDSDYEGGWRGEYWGKMMRGACLVYMYVRSPALYRILSDTVEDIMTAADEDGRISTYAKSHELESWDLWCRKYVLLGMQYFLEICEDDALRERIVRSMQRQADCIIGKVGKGEGKKPITACTRNWRGLNASSILEPIVGLYRLTGEQRYLDFAQYIADSGATDVENVFRLALEDQLYPYQYPVTKAYEMMSCFEGLLALYRITGEEWYRTATVNFANKILESDFTVIGSCGCTHELFDHSSVRQANTTNEKIQQETCVTVTLMKLMYQLTLLTGDGKYADAFEISLYNAYLGAMNTENVIEPMILREHPDWVAEPLPFDSYSPLTAGTRGNGIGGLRLMSDRHYYGCCACIGSAGLGLVPRMQLLRTEDGFAVNLYVAGTVSADTPGGQRILFDFRTEYPKHGETEIRLRLPRPEGFRLLLRNPHWSQKTKLTLNGKPLSVSEGYIAIEREWRDGDTLSLMLDMRTQAIRPIPYGSQILMNKVVWDKDITVPRFDREDPLAREHLAFRRGPIMLAQDGRLGYSLSDAASVRVRADGYVDAQLPAEKKAAFDTVVEAALPLADGSYMPVVDYASAGKLFSEKSRMAVWMRVAP
ncbi:MAG: glycoside hydrolase family 127 protein [Clostridia bacterium]|nr:glycoside hydrolase family 127 protein [Clostridia bacterium]